jgi:hypothetical protein
MCASHISHIPLKGCAGPHPSSATTPHPYGYLTIRAGLPLSGCNRQSAPKDNEEPAGGARVRLGPPRARATAGTAAGRGARGDRW